MIPTLPGGLVGSIEHEKREDACSEEAEEAEEEDTEVGVADCWEFYGQLLNGWWEARKKPACSGLAL